MRITRLMPQKFRDYINKILARLDALEKRVDAIESE